MQTAIRMSATGTPLSRASIPASTVTSHGCSTFTSELPHPSSGYLTQALDLLDRKFEELTVDDGGEALATALGAATTDLGDGWWWHRRPEPVPWPGG